MASNHENVPIDLGRIAKKLGGDKAFQEADGWLTCCPVHGDKKPSLSICLSDNHDLIAHCHAGCDWRTVKDKLREKGLLPESNPSSQTSYSKPEYIWNKSTHSPGEIKKYFRTRSFELDHVSGCFRLNTYKDKQMIVAKVSRPGDIGTKAIHRTFIDHDYRKTGRKMLGACKGRAVWISEPQEKMLVGEGIETTLSAMLATGLPGISCLSVSGMKAVTISAKVKEIIILVDSDDKQQAGQKAALELARRFKGKVRLATPDDSCFTDSPRKLDFNDLTLKQIQERFEKLIDPSSLYSSTGEQKNKQSEISLFDENGKPKTKATVLIEIGSQYELFHDETGEGYATITRDAHKETWPIKSKVFTELLADQYFILSNKGVSRNVVTDATDTLRGKARVRGKQHKIYRRTAALNGTIFIDLCDNQWRAVEVTREGWRIVDNSPIKFLRSPSSQALPIPEEGGSLDDLWPLINVKLSDRPLVAGFVVRALHPTPPYFGFCIIGEQGTAKSTGAKIIRYLVDPSTAMLRPPPKDERDFLAGAVNNWCICYDNLSGMQPWISDSLCRLLTGGSFAARTLYSTTEETTIPLARPAILNGIDDLTSRPDLADRVIVLNLLPIKDCARMDERELWERFDNIKRKIFGVILNGLCSALRNIDNVTLPYKPRMLDAAKWATAAEEGLGLVRGSFMKSYADNQRDMVSISLEASPFIAALLDMVKENRQWEGKPTELLSLLPNYARDEETIRSKAWPKSPAWVTRVLRRHAPALRKIGVEIESSRDVAGGHIRVSWKRMTVESKKATSYSQDFYELEKPAEETAHKQGGEDAVFTVNTVMNRANPDSKDSKNHKLSVEDNDEWEEF